MKTISSRFTEKPHTRLGWWAAGLLTLFVIVFILYTLVLLPLSRSTTAEPVAMPNYGIALVLCGLASGIVGLVALLRCRERSWLVWLSLLPGLFSFLLLMGDLFSAPGW